MPRRLVQWLATAAVLAGVGGVGGLAVAASGLVNVSAIPPHPDVWARFLHFASQRSFSMHAATTKPPAPLDDPAMVMLGAVQYNLVCAHCHGAPGYGQSPVALSMRPEPPAIYNTANQLSDGEMFFAVHDGVRYTAMPAWTVENRPDEVWAMVAFLKAMPTMSREKYLELARGDDGARGANPGAALGPSALDVRNASLLTPPAETSSDPQYLPGNIQNPYSSEASRAFPRTGFVSVAGSDADALCTRCHGADGRGRAGGPFPNLTLQTPQYLYDALKAFASGKRQSGIMWPIAANLSDEQMRALATRFGEGPAIATENVSNATAAEKATGREIATAGVAASQGEPPSAKVERCTGCHIAMPQLDRIIPRIDGQHAAYTRMQLWAFRAGGRGDTGPYDPMVAETHAMTDAEIDAVSRYYATRPPVAKN